MLRTDSTHHNDVDYKRVAAQRLKHLSTYNKTSAVLQLIFPKYNNNNHNILFNMSGNSNSAASENAERFEEGQQNSHLLNDPSECPKSLI